MTCARGMLAVALCLLALPVASAHAALTVADVAFGEHPADDALLPFQEAVVTNDGVDPVAIGTPALAGANPDQFELDGSGCENVTLAATETCSVILIFEPTEVGDFAAQVDLPNDGLTNPQSFAVTGTGTPPPTDALVANPAGLDFGPLAVGAPTERSVVVTNTSDSFAPTVGQAALDAPFTLGTEDCSDHVLFPGASCTIDVGLTAAAASASYQGVLTVPSTGGTLTVSLAGSGAAPPDPGPQPPVTPPVLPRPTITPPKFAGPLFTARLTPRSMSLKARSATLRVVATRAGVGKPVLSLTGRDRKAFVVEQTTCTGPLARAKDSCTFQIRFTGHAGGAYEAVAHVGDGTATVDVDLDASAVLASAALQRMLRASAAMAMTSLRHAGLAKAISEGLLVRGIEPGQTGVLRAQLRAGKRTLGKARAFADDDGAARIRVRPNRAGKAFLRGAKRVRVTALLTFAGDSDDATARVKVSTTLRR